MNITHSQTRDDLARVRDIIEQRIYEVKTELPMLTRDRCWTCPILNLLLWLTRLVRRLV